MMSQPGIQTIAIYILLNISRTKGNDIIKFDQLIKSNMRNIFLKKLYSKYLAISRLFLKIQN